MALRRGLLLIGIWSTIGCGDNTADVLVDVSDVPAGEQCAAGGIAVASGHDDDGDGQLDAEEIEDARVDCDAVPSAIVVREDAEPAGEHCANGGVAVHSGRDTDGDGALHDDEIEQTTYVCDALEVWEGNLVMHAADAERYRDLRVVTGDLTVSGPGVVELPVLELVGGDVHVATYDGEARLPALTTIGGDLDAGAPGALDHLERVGGAFLTHLGSVEHAQVPALTWIGGGIEVQSWYLETLDLPALETIIGDVTIIHAPDLTALRMPALTTIVGDVTIRAGEGLTAIDHLPSLAEVQGRIEIRGDMERVSLPALTKAAGDVDIDGDVLREVSLPVLVSALGYVRVDSDVLEEVDLHTLVHAQAVGVHGNVGGLDANEPGTLVSFDLSSLRTVDSNVFLGGFAAVTELSLASLEDVGNKLRVNGLGAMERISLPVLDEAKIVWIEDGGSLRSLHINPSAEVELLTLNELGSPLDPETTWLPYEVTGTVWIAEVALDDLQVLSDLRRAGRLWLYDITGLHDLSGLSASLQLYSLRVDNNPELASLAGLEGLRTLGGNLEIWDNHALTSLEGLANLEVVGGDVNINGNGLTTLDGCGIRAIGGSLKILFNDLLVSLAGLAPLTTVTGELDIAYNHALPQSEIDALRARLEH